MRYYPGAELAEEPTNWWGPNQQCVEALLRTAGFAEIYFTRNPFHPLRGIFHARRTNGRAVGWRSVPNSVLALGGRGRSSTESTATRDESWADALGSIPGRAYRRFKRWNGLTPEEIITA